MDQTKVASNTHSKDSAEPEKNVDNSSRSKSTAAILPVADISNDEPNTSSIPADSFLKNDIDSAEPPFAQYFDHDSSALLNSTHTIFSGGANSVYSNSKFTNSVYISPEQQFINFKDFSDKRNSGNGGDYGLRDGFMGSSNGSTMFHSVRSVATNALKNDEEHSHKISAEERINTVTDNLSKNSPGIRTPKDETDPSATGSRKFGTIYQDLGQQVGRKLGSFISSASSSDTSNRSFWKPSSIYSESDHLLNNRPSLIRNSKGTKLGQSTIYNKLIEDDQDQNEMENDSYCDEELPEIYTDQGFAYLYWIGMIIMVGLGIIYLFTTTAIPKNVYHSLWYGYEQSREYIGWLILGSAMLGCVWLFVLKRFIKSVIWLTILLVPLGLFAVSLWSFYSLFTAPVAIHGQKYWSLLQSSISFGLALLSSVIIHKRRTNIKQGLELVEISVEILIEYPSIFIVSLGLIVMYFVMILAWMALFGRLALVGHIDEKKYWVPDHSSPSLMLYFIGMMLWTSAIFTYLERTMISGVVCEWFFHRHNPVRKAQISDPAVEALKRCLTYNFGTISFAALILTGVHLLKISSTVTKKLLTTASGTNVSLNENSTVGSFILACFNWLENSIEGINSYALVYVAYSGTDMITAAKNCFSLFRRNMIQAFLLDNVTKIVLLLGVYTMSLVASVATFNFAARIYRNNSSNGNPLTFDYAWLISVIGTILSFFVTRFFTFIITQIMDALFVCYVIDVDSNKCHSTAIHRIFSDMSDISSISNYVPGFANDGKKPKVMKPALQV